MTEVSENSNLNETVWISALSTLLNEFEIKRLASVIKPKIQGFSANNITKAPIIMLRKKTIEQLKQLKAPLSVFEKLYSAMIGKVRSEGTSFEEYCQSVQYSQEYSFADALVIVGTVFPEKYMQHQNKINDNITRNEHPLKGISSKKLTFKRELQLLSSAIEYPIDEQQIQGIMRLHSTDPSSIETTLKNWLRQRNTTETGELVLAAVQFRQEWESWQEGEKAVFLELALKDSLGQLLLTHRNYETIQAQNEQKLKEYEKKIFRLEKKLQEQDTSDQSLRTQLRDMETKMSAKEDELKHLTSEIANWHERCRSLETELRQAAMRSAPSQTDLIDETNVILLTRYEPELYEPLLKTEQVLQIGAMSALAGIELTADQFVFIHSDGFSTPEQFEIEDYLSQLEVGYRSVSGTAVSAIRKLICYLEGGWSDEIN